MTQREGGGKGKIASGSPSSPLPSRGTRREATSGTGGEGKIRKGEKKEEGAAPARHLNSYEVAKWRAAWASFRKGGGKERGKSAAMRFLTSFFL